MKITKSLIKQLIKEELGLLSEQLAVTPTRARMERGAEAIGAAVGAPGRSGAGMAAAFGAEDEPQQSLEDPEVLRKQKAKDVKKGTGRSTGSKDVRFMKAQVVRAWKNMKNAAAKKGKTWKQLSYNDPLRQAVRDANKNLKAAKAGFTFGAPETKKKLTTQQRMQGAETPEEAAAAAAMEKKVGATPVGGAAKPAAPAGGAAKPTARAGGVKTTSTDVTDPKTGGRTGTQTSQATLQGVTTTSRREGNYIIVTAKHPDGRTAEGRAKMRGNLHMSKSSAAAKARRALARGQ